MDLSARQSRLRRWCSDKYDDPRPMRWLKDRVFKITMRHYERHIPIVW